MMFIYIYVYIYINPYVLSVIAVIYLLGYR